jgi:hypothetical protein
MNRIAIASLPLVFGLMAFAEPLPPPIEPANDGKLLCMGADTARKTCNDLTQYTRAEDGVVWSHTFGLIEEELDVTVRGSSPVEIKNGSVCERVRPEHVESFEFTVAPSAAGQAFDAKVYKDFAIAVARAMKHHDLCTVFVPTDEGFIVKYVINGQQSRFPDERAIWVSPEDGYRVGR